MGVTTNHGTTQTLEEVARTVYVGNVNPSTTPEELMNFFSVCGPITFCRMAGDDAHTNRFAFIEFATLVRKRISYACESESINARMNE
jgi:RNA recognition motif-containing protein